MNDEQIRELLHWFVNEAQPWMLYAEARRHAIEGYHQWIQPGTIEQMPDDELRWRFQHFFRIGFNDGSRIFPQQYLDELIGDINRLRQTLLFLLNENIHIIERMNRVTNGGDHYIEGMGRALQTSLLMCYNPDKYCLWSKKTDRGLSNLGLLEQVHGEGGTWGHRYVRFLNVSNGLKELEPEFDLTFAEIDLFLRAIADEGQEAVRREQARNF